MTRKVSNIQHNQVRFLMNVICVEFIAWKKRRKVHVRPSHMHKSLGFRITSKKAPGFDMQSHPKLMNFKAHSQDRNWKSV
jgi:hypothetical protein